jgi:ryanodine receptor 2
MTLNDKMTELVELLAENTHNVWAKERIKTGWTYGLNEVGHLDAINYQTATIS